MTTAPQPRTADRMEQVAAMTREGLSVRQMAERLGLTADSLRSWATRNRVPLPNRHKAISIERIKLVAAMTEEGLTVRQMAARLNVSESVLRRWSYKHSVQLPRVPTSDELYDQRMAAIDPDKTPQEIADDLGLEKTTLTSWARKAGVKLPNTDDVLASRRRTAILALIEEGLQRKEIADRLDMALGSLQSWCSDHDIELPRTPKPCRRCRKVPPTEGAYCKPCHDRRARAAALLAASTGTPANIPHRAIEFREWSPPPSLYGGVSPNATATWHADCAGCGWHRVGDDETHARGLAVAHNLDHHPEVRAA